MICLLRRLRASSFLFLLAISDILFSLDLLPGWIHVAFIRSLYTGANFVCKIQTYVSFIASFLHIWMVLAFTAERFFAIYFPLKHMSRCTQKFSRTIILMIAAPVLLFYIYPSFFASEPDANGQCREKESHVHYLKLINIIDTIMTMVLPFILVSIINILIIRKLFCFNKFRSLAFENGSSYHIRRMSDWSSYKTESVKKPEKNRTSLDRSLSIMNRKQACNESTRRHILTELRLTKMLLAISLTCLSLNFPSYYLRLILFYEQTDDDSKSNQSYSVFTLYRDVLLHYMSYLSYSVNIFIYILFGVNFRRALLRLFCPKKINSNRLNPKSSGDYNQISLYDH